LIVAAPVLLERLAALADVTRGRMVLLLEAEELTVSELCAVLQQPQSTVSRHLKVLADLGWVQSRRDGTSRYYRATLGERDGAPRKIWLTVRDQIASTPGAAQDARRLAGVRDRRRTTSQAFFATAARDWDRLRGELFGREFSSHALLGFLDPEWTMGDLGCGTGQISAALAPFVRQVIAVDGSAEMLQAARRRLHGLANVVVRRGELETLPIETATLDGATLVLVLHHLPQPAAALREAARVLKPCGRVMIVDMLPHDREEYKQQMGHIWLGFSEERITADLREAGFERVRVHALPPERETKGPSLFVAIGDRNRN
jgi:ubiquinone/menaquinone biosynthesis C-methylase UbiE/DNA-binding transcriptional ArsR family regulator